MESFAPIIAIVCIAALVVLALVANQNAQRRAEERRVSLYDFATKNGFEYHSEGLNPTNEGSFWQRFFGIGPGSEEDQFISVFQDFRPFGEGHTKTIDNLMVKQDGDTDWYLFDYTYKVTTGSGESSSTRTYSNSVVAARLPVLLPLLSMTRESMMTKLGHVFGDSEVEFESADFNKRYSVLCQDKRAAFDLMHPQMIEFLMQIPILDWQMSGPYLVLYVNEYLDAQGYSNLWWCGSGFVQRIPGYVLKDRGFQPPWKGPLDQMGNLQN